MAALKVNDQNFLEEVVKSKIPVLVDFSADWCGPCKMMSPIIDGIADDLAGKVKVVKVNVDEAQGLAAQFNVMSIPNLVFFNSGKVVDQVTGAMSQEMLLDKIAQNFK